LRPQNRRYESESTFNIDSWQPRTDVGRRVKSKEITSIEQIFHEGRHIQETEIVDALIPDIKNEVIEISSVQRMTKNNRKAKYRVTAIVGDGRGHVGVGSGKEAEVKAAIERAVKNAKANVIPVIFGCGSWQCACGTAHSLPVIVKGKCGSVDITLKPAPRGLGIVASEPVKKMLELAGVKDLWSFSRGRTRTKYNTLIAVFKALKSENSMKNSSLLEAKR
jgi:small subunit ribosomal protein S5